MRAKELKRCLSPPMRVANKLTPEPILRYFYNQMKVRQALDKSRKFVKTTIYKYRVVYTAQTKARQALDIIKDIQAKKTSTKNKGSSFKKKYNILLQRLENKGQIHQASSSREEISILRLSTILLAKSSTSGSTFSMASRYS